MQKLQIISRFILFLYVITFLVASPTELVSKNVVHASKETKKESRTNHNGSEISIHKVYQSSNIVEIQFAEAEFIESRDWVIFQPLVIIQKLSFSNLTLVFQKILLNHFIASNAP